MKLSDYVIDFIARRGVTLPLRRPALSGTGET